MSSTKHTPGPWKILNSRDWVYVNAHGNIAKISNSDYCVENEMMDRTALANAKLIAASPDMFEVISDLLDSYQTGNHRLEYNTIEKMKMLINKITGEKINS